MSTPATPAESAAETQPAPHRNPKLAVPVMLFLFVFALVIDNAFKNMSAPISGTLGLSLNTVSLQATLAGLIIGIGAVVYSMLADTTSIRRLMVWAIGFMAVGSIIGFLGQHVWGMVLFGRIVQTAGLAAAETLYVVYVTKYLSARDQKTYLGFSTAAFQLSMALGIMGSGIIANQGDRWPLMFLITLVAVVLVPFIVRLVPRDRSAGRRPDLLGPLLIGVLAAGLLMFLQAFDALWLIPAAVALVGFIWHVRSHSFALVTPEFFRNLSYVLVLIIVFIMYSANLGMVLVLPTMTEDLHGLSFAQASLISFPGFILAAIVGTLSGQIAKVLDSQQAITLALVMIAVGIGLSAALVGTWVPVYYVSMALMACGFALMYAPLLSTAVSAIPAERTGVAIGFYNLTINVAIPLGLALTAAILSSGSTVGGALSTAQGHAGVYATALWVLTGLAVLALILYRIFARILERRGYDIHGRAPNDDDAEAVAA